MYITSDSWLKIGLHRIECLECNKYWKPVKQFHILVQFSVDELKDSLPGKITTMHILGNGGPRGLVS